MNFRIPKSDILFSLLFPLHNKSNDFYFKYNYLEIGILNISDLIVQYLFVMLIILIRCLCHYCFCSDHMSSNCYLHSLGNY